MQHYFPVSRSCPETASRNEPFCVEWWDVKSRNSNERVVVGRSVGLDAGYAKYRRRPPVSAEMWLRGSSRRKRGTLKMTLPSVTATTDATVNVVPMI